MGTFVLVRVKIPGAEGRFDFLAPRDLRVHEFQEAVSDLLSRQVGGYLALQAGVSLLLVDGPRAGMVLGTDERLDSLVSEGILVDGSTVLMV